MSISITVYSPSHVDVLEEKVNALSSSITADFDNAFSFGSCRTVENSKLEVLQSNSEDFGFRHNNPRSYFIVFLDKKSAAGEIQAFIQELDSKLRSVSGDMLYLLNGETPINTNPQK